MASNKPEEALICIARNRESEEWTAYGWGNGPRVEMQNEAAEQHRGATGDVPDEFILVRVTLPPPQVVEIEGEVVDDAD